MLVHLFIAIPLYVAAPVQFDLTNTYYEDFDMGYEIAFNFTTINEGVQQGSSTQKRLEIWDAN